MATVGVLDNDVNNLRVNNGNLPGLLGVSLRSSNSSAFRIGQLIVVKEQLHATGIRRLVRLNTHGDGRTRLHVLNGQDSLILTTEPEVSRTIVSTETC